MPAVNVSNLPTIPYVYSGTTPATINTCQLVTIPNVPGVAVILHNRDKASRELRISFDPALTQGGAAPTRLHLEGVSSQMPRRPPGRKSS